MTTRHGRYHLQAVSNIKLKNAYDESPMSFIELSSGAFAIIDIVLCHFAVDVSGWQSRLQNFPRRKSFVHHCSYNNPASVWEWAMWNKPPPHCSCSSCINCTKRNKQRLGLLWLLYKLEEGLSCWGSMLQYNILKLNFFPAFFCPASPVSSTLSN